jgi:purine nucleosidase
VVFEAGFEITVIPWAPLTLNDAVFGRPQLAEIEAIGTDLSRFFLRVCGDTLAFDESVGIPGTTHPDSLSVAVMLHPDLVLRAADYNVAIETDSDLTRGYSAMSWGVHGLPANARVVEKVDAAAFYAYIKGILSAQRTASRPLR